MRVKFPQVLCFQEWVDLWSLPDKNPSVMPKETVELRNLRKKVIETLERHNEAILEVEEAMVNYAQEYTILDPPTYTAKIKDAKTGIEYLTAKTFWPMVGGKKKEIRIYIGKPDNLYTPNFKSKYFRYFNEKIAVVQNSGIADNYFKFLAKELMQEALKKKRKDGDI
jgi:hypothetical protein